MVDERRFCRFSRDPSHAIAIREIPDDGFCLNAFVLLSPRGRTGMVLLGRPNPSAPWDRIGGLEPKRVEGLKDRWMLPSSQLIFGESPQAAARRIVAEQLEQTDIALRGPEVYSEVYPSASRPQFTHHWDLQFLFRGELGPEQVPRSSAFTELGWKSAEETPASAFCRSHHDILRLTGLRTRDP